MRTSADFSADRVYRYRLTRQWDETQSPACFIMLNPSTADEVENDPTISRCQKRSETMGYGGLVALNIFALRSTDPNALYTSQDPIGPENDEYILHTASEAGIVICGWGQHGRLGRRGQKVLKMLKETGVQPHALRINSDGSPAHPLYLSYTLLPIKF